MQVLNKVNEIFDETIDECLEKAEAYLPKWNYIYMDGTGQFWASTCPPKFSYGNRGELRVAFEHESCESVCLGVSVVSHQLVFRITKEEGE